jgi:hypothetical protein
MSKSSEMEVKHGKEIGGIVHQFLYRLPKKNHEAMIQLEKQFVDGSRSNGGLRYEVFQLNGMENMMEWTNIAKTMSANQDEEIWVEQVHYRDGKQSSRDLRNNMPTIDHFKIPADDVERSSTITCRQSFT